MSRLMAFRPDAEDCPMTQTSREFQIFAKPAGSLCNLECRYCYYLRKEDLYESGEPFRMADHIRPPVEPRSIIN